MTLKEFKQLWKDGNGYLFDNIYEHGRDYFTYNNVKIECIYTGSANIDKNNERRIKCYHKAFNEALKDYPDHFKKPQVVVCTTLEGQYELW